VSRITEENAFPWTFDQFQRYEVLRVFIEVFYPGRPITALDVGGLSPDREGKTAWLPLRRVFQGESFALDRLSCRETAFVRGDGVHLPFKDRAFDVVAALDVIEHVAGQDRVAFVDEMGRVAKSAVVISAPFRDEHIERTEAALLEQISRLYGVTHQQLKEHREKGLPDVSDISRALRHRMSSGVDFSYGSLANWLSLQAIKNCFLFQRNSGKIQALLDRWLSSAASISESEFEPPFSRHYWLQTKDIGQEELERGVEVLKKRLKESRSDFCFPEHLSLPREMAEFFRGDRVSAVVVSDSGRNLKECLNHLLTQGLPLDLEVVVWDLGKSGEAEKIVRESYPALKCHRTGREGKVDSALLKVLSNLRGNFFLLISENILLPKDAVGSLYQRLKETSESTLLTPRVVQGKHAYNVWTGGPYSLSRAAAGRMANIFWRLKDRNPAWVYSECLFFRREAALSKTLSNSPLKARNIFLWRKGEDRDRWIYRPEIVVYRK
jgi:Methyltransferase domain